MKLSKKTMTTLSFTLGACIFLSTAFADAMLGSGYDRLKQAAKQTAAQMEQGLDNFTVEAMITLKDNGETLLHDSMQNKFDSVTQASENISTKQYAGGESTKDYSYSDKKLTVWKHGSDDRFYATEFPEDVDRRHWFANPFNEKGAPEIEKIVDALVGNLKDYVQAEEKPDGSKVYSGTLSEAQVPAVVNAVTSFGLKQMLNDQGHVQRNAKLTEIESDIFVKKVTGTAVETKSGLLESLTGDVLLVGKDKNGTQHDLTLNVVFKLSNVGTTKVIKPDLTGVTVEKVSHHGGFSSKFVGIYKNNIVMEKDGKFVKIGERTLEITSVESNKVTGTYTEKVKPGFEAQYPEPQQFTFQYDQSSAKSMNTFTYTNSQGKQEAGQLHASGNGKLFLDVNIEILSDNSYTSNNRQYYDPEFTRVFEE
jgi:hypothetical protein